MTKVVLSIGTKRGVQKVPGSPKQHCKNHQFDWIEVSMKDLLFTQDGLSAQVALHHLDLSLRMLEQRIDLCSQNSDDNRKYIFGPWQIAVE